MIASLYYIHMQLLLVILIWEFGELYKDQQINCTPLILHNTDAIGNQQVISLL